MTGKVLTGAKAARIQRAALLCFIGVAALFVLASCKKAAGDPYETGDHSLNGAYFMQYNNAVARGNTEYSFSDSGYFYEKHYIDNGAGVRETWYSGQYYIEGGELFFKTTDGGSNPAYITVGEPTFSKISIEIGNRGITLDDKFLTKTSSSPGAIPGAGKHTAAARTTSSKSTSTAYAGNGANFNFNNIDGLDDVLDIFTNLENFTNGLKYNVNSGLRSFFVFIGFVTLVFGLIQCFFGYKIFKIWLGIIGFIVGAILGAAIGAALGGSAGDSSAAMAGAVFGALALGVLFAVLFVKLYFIGVFLTVGFLSFVVFLIFTKNLAVALVLGLICGVIGAIVKKWFIICSTAISGAFSAGMGVIFMFGAPLWVRTAIGIIFSIIGIWYQGFRKPKGATAVADASSVAVNAVSPAGDSTYCPFCGATVASGEEFCAKYGGAMKKSPKPAAATESALINEPALNKPPTEDVGAYNKETPAEFNESVATEPEVAAIKSSFCANCGSALKDGVRFCGGCGSAV